MTAPTPRILLDKSPAQRCEFAGCGALFDGDDSFCSQACRQAWIDEERRYEIYLDTRDDDLPDPPDYGDYLDDGDD